MTALNRSPNFLKIVSCQNSDCSVCTTTAAIPSEQFSSECLPPKEVLDLLSYLGLETSYYTNQQVRAFKSLEA